MFVLLSKLTKMATYGLIPRQINSTALISSCVRSISLKLKFFLFFFPISLYNLMNSMSHVKTKSYRLKRQANVWLREVEQPIEQAYCWPLSLENLL